MKKKANLLRALLVFSAIALLECPSPGGGDNESFSLTVFCCPETGGSVSIAPDRASYREGETVILLATENLDRTFAYWDGDCSEDCNPLTLVMDSDKVINANFLTVRKEWTLMVYVDADNNLESFAIDDLNEMEAIDLGGQGISIVALVDRISG